MSQIPDVVPVRGVSLRERIQRLRTNLAPVLQTAGAAAVAFFIATDLLDHTRPVFAPLSAVICLGAVRGQQLQRALELTIGVAVGIGVADLLVRGIGQGPWQIALVGTLAMAVALFVGGGPFLVLQAGISAILVASVDPVAELVPTRFFDALVGGGVALVVSQLLFPFDPRTLVSRAARPVFGGLVATLRELADALERGDARAANDALLHARDIDASVRAFNDAITQGHDIARLAPPRRRARGQLEVYAVAASQVDLAVRNARVLARAARGLIRLGGPAPRPVVQAIRDLADAVAALERRLDDPEEAIETRDLALAAVTAATSVLESPQELVLSSVVGQIRLTASDLLRATGLSLADSQQALDRATGVVPPDDDS